ncbi:MAG: hypothetical protein RLZZ450_6165 [Pseudomonadota bacterium]
MKSRVFGLLAAFTLAACGGAQRRAVTYDFADSAVKPSCACTEQTPLALSDALGERSVESQQADMARTWQGTLHWHEQPWFAASGETNIRLEFSPRQAFAARCRSDPSFDCGAERYAMFATEISSADGLLRESLQVRVSYLPEANVNAALHPVGLWSRRKHASDCELMMALSREGDVLKGKLYVLAPESGTHSSLVEHVVGDWEAAPLSTP